MLLQKPWRCPLSLPPLGHSDSVSGPHTAQPPNRLTCTATNKTSKQRALAMHLRKTFNPTKIGSHVAKCYTIVFPGRKSVLRPGFRLDFNRETFKISHPAC